MRKQIKVAAAILLQDGAVFATQRGYGEFKDWWEFPGGKVEPGEMPEETVVREIQEELSVKIAVDQYFMSVEYDYPLFHLSMDCFLCHVTEGQITLLEHEAARWLRRDELNQVRWLPADEEIIEKLHRVLCDSDDVLDLSPRQWMPHL